MSDIEIDKNDPMFYDDVSEYDVPSISNMGVNALNMFISRGGPREAMFYSELAAAKVVKNPDVCYGQSGVEGVMHKHTFRVIVPQNDKGWTITHIIKKTDGEYIFTRCNDTHKFDVIVIPLYHLKNPLGNGFIPIRMNQSYLVVGNTLPPGLILSAPPTAVNDGEWNFGFNVNTILTTSIKGIEDTMAISQRLVDRSQHTLIQKITVPFPKDKMGVEIERSDGDFTYIPRVGDVIKPGGIVIATRTIPEDTEVFRLSPKQLRVVDEFTDDIYRATSIPENATVISVKVLPNKTRSKSVIDVYDDRMKLLSERTRHVAGLFEEVLKHNFGYCKKHGIDDVYTPEANAILVHEVKRADPNMIHQVKKTDMSPYTVEVVLEYTCTLHPASKFVGKHGDKGVISRVIPTEKMPRDKHGNIVDVILSSPIPENREIPSVDVEGYIFTCIRNVDTLIKNKINPPNRRVKAHIRSMMKQDRATINEVWDLIIDIHDVMSKVGCAYLKEVAHDDEFVLNMLTDICKANFALVLTVDALNENPHYEIYEAVKGKVYEPLIDKLHYYDADKNEWLWTENDILVDSRYMFPLTMDGYTSLSATPSYVIQSQNVMSRSPKGNRHYSPIRAKNPAHLSLDEAGQLPEILSPEAVAEVYDRCSNPHAHSSSVAVKIRSEKPTAIHNTVDRDVVPFGGPRDILENILSMYGTVLYDDQNK